jgi:hypothetical protein
LTTTRQQLTTDNFQMLACGNRSNLMSVNYMSLISASRVESGHNTEPGSKLAFVRMSSPTAETTEQPTAMQTDQCDPDMHHRAFFSFDPSLFLADLGNIVSCCYCCTDTALLANGPQ